MRFGKGKNKTKDKWAHHVIKDKKLYVRHGTSLMVYDIAAS
ncbi:MAG: hypothetical protein NTX93_02795 [Bacteroidia bacterium]|nr:hypothetical protein [Bacteroidia bacterium]